MRTVLITGANRGLGLEFCRQYSAAGWKVLACCRNPKEADELSELAWQCERLSIHALEMRDFGQIDQLAAHFVDESVDVLLINSGVYGDTPQTRFGAMDYTRWLDTLVVNSQAPVKMAEAFLPQVARSPTKLIVAMSSLMGSMGDNRGGGSIMYRTSKAALNAAMKSLSIDLKGQGIGVLILHPGWVKTDMGGTQAPTSPAESVAGMIQVIEQFKPEHSGRFINFRGEELSW